jgi:hypothetical protein
VQVEQKSSQLIQGELDQLVSQSGAITEWLQSFQKGGLTSDQLLLALVKIEFDNGKRLDRLIELLTPPDRS